MKVLERERYESPWRVIRPLATLAGLAASKTTWRERLLYSWFGIRGIGSIYYLMFAVGFGIETGLAERFVGVTLTIVCASILLHGISVTPLMRMHTRARAADSRGRVREVPRTGRVH